MILKRFTVINKTKTIEPRIYIMVFSFKNESGGYTHHREIKCDYSLDKAIEKSRYLYKGDNICKMQNLFSHDNITITEIKSFFKHV